MARLRAKFDRGASRVRILGTHAQFTVDAMEVPCVAKADESGSILLKAPDDKQSLLADLGRLEKLAPAARRWQIFEESRILHIGGSSLPC
jgi:hypothetical protein